MQLKRFFSYCFSSLSGLTAFADTFIVTSNADRGPGTLREVITLANTNGTTFTDYIHFNTADVTESGRAIILQSLPIKALLY